MCNKVNGKLYSWSEMQITPYRVMCGWMQMSFTLQSAYWRAQCQHKWGAHRWLEKTLRFALDKNKLSTRDEVGAMR